MNKFKDFAKLFNLDLEEKFYIKHINDDKPFKELYKFTEDGLKIYITDGWSSENYSVLFHLLKGDYEIVYLPFKPKDGEVYWFLDYTEPSWRNWNGDYEDFTFWKCGNCFKTKEDAETKGKEIMEQIKKEYMKELQL